MKTIKTVPEYIQSHPKYENILSTLRTVLLDTQLTETIKWGMPTYCLGRKNVVGIGAFKHYAGLWFFNGVFLKDPSRVLINAQEDKTKGMRQWRFTSIKHVDITLIRQYIDEAIHNQLNGKELKPEKRPLIIPMELQDALNTNKKLNEAFHAMSLSHKREYCNYISEAKKPETRIKRILKITPIIIDKSGLNDQYRSS